MHTYNIKASFVSEKQAKEFSHLCRLLQWAGNVGTSLNIEVFADGDGNCRPKFEIDEEYGHPSPTKQEEDDWFENDKSPFICFD